MSEERWEEEARKLSESFSPNLSYRSSFIKGYLAACRKRQEERVITLNKIADSISRIPAECNCITPVTIGHEKDCRWKGLRDAEQLVREEAK